MIKDYRKKLKEIISKMWKILFEVNTYEETLPNGTKHIAVYNKLGTLQNTKKFKVPENHFFY